MVFNIDQSRWFVPSWPSTPDQISFSYEGGVSYFDRVGVMYSMDTWNIHPFRSVFGIWTANIQPELAAELASALYLVCDTCKWRNNHVSSHSLFSRLGWFDTACPKSRLLLIARSLVIGVVIRKVARCCPHRLFVAESGRSTYELLETHYLQWCGDSLRGLGGRVCSMLDSFYLFYSSF